MGFHCTVGSCMMTCDAQQRFCWVNALWNPLWPNCSDSVISFTVKLMFVHVHGGAYMQVVLTGLLGWYVKIPAAQESRQSCVSQYICFNELDAINTQPTGANASMITSHRARGWNFYCGHNLFLSNIKKTKYKQINKLDLLNLPQEIYKKLLFPFSFQTGWNWT